jgi:AraC-like DNA-binding protein
VGAAGTADLAPLDDDAARVVDQDEEALRPSLTTAKGEVKKNLWGSPHLICQVKSVLFAALSRLFAGLPKEQNQRISLHAQGNNPAAITLRYIDEHLDSDLSNGILASIAEFSEDHFVRLFRKHVGQTPAQYVLERRLAVATERLVFTNDSIDRIASACGFPDRFYFSRMFRRRMGLPPAAYRKTSHQQA